MKRLLGMMTLILVAMGLAAFVNAHGDIRSIDGRIGDSVHKVVIESVGNELKFAQTEFTVKAGEKVRLVFENKATAQGMAHNVVILKRGVDSTVVDRVGLAAIQAADTGYIPEDDAILFHTSLAAPGEVVEVTFEAPSEAGEYPYLCSFPGHFVVMRGIMTVT